MFLFLLFYKAGENLTYAHMVLSPRFLYCSEYIPLCTAFYGLKPIWISSVGLNHRLYNQDAECMKESMSLR